MKILIDTDGFSKNTVITINGRKIENSSFFGVSVKFPGKVKVTDKEKIRLADGSESERPRLSLWGANLSDYDR